MIKLLLLCIFISFNCSAVEESAWIKFSHIVGEDGVGSSHIDRGGVVGAEGDGWGAASGGDAGGAGEGGDVFKAYLLAERDGGC